MSTKRDVWLQSFGRNSIATPHATLVHFLEKKKAKLVGIVLHFLPKGCLRSGSKTTAQSTSAKSPRCIKDALEKKAFFVQTIARVATKFAEDFLCWNTRVCPSFCLLQVELCSTLDYFAPLFIAVNL